MSPKQFSYDLFSGILDSVRTAVVVVDADLRVVAVNHAAETLFSISRKRAVGQLAHELVVLSDQSRSRLCETLMMGTAYTDRGITLSLPGKSKITVDYSAGPLRMESFEPHLVIEFSGVDRQLRIAREEALISQQQAARQLARGLAHEVKNPLGGLRGAAQLLEAELPDPRLQEYTGIIIREADRLQVLIDRMLGPHQQPNPKWINIHQVVEHVRQLLQAQACETVEFDTDYDPSVPPLYADLDWLIQALLNVGANALQAIDNHGKIQFRTRVLLGFTIGQTLHRQVVQVQVIDNGPGVPAEMRETVFYPMVTGRADGTGLGLSIAQGLVNQLGGLIECDSEPGCTRFTLLLPAPQANHE